MIPSIQSRCEHKSSVPKAKAQSPEALLIPDTVAAALVGVSRATWQRLRSAGKLPAAVKLGRAVRWRRAEIVSWISAGCPSADIWQAMRQQESRRRAHG